MRKVMRFSLVTALLCRTYLGQLATASVLNESPLKDKHLIVAGIESAAHFHMARNSSGHILEFQGTVPEVLNWMRRAFHFTYSMLQVNESVPFDSTANQKGLDSFIQDNKCDVVATIAMTVKRAQKVSFTHITTYGSIAYLIPSFDSSSFNIFAMFLPFSYRIWIGMFGSIVAVILSLSFFIWKCLPKEVFQKTLSKMTVYVLGLLLIQHGYCDMKRPPIQIVIGVWALAAFVLINCYTTFLTSFMTAPNSKPLITSIFDLRDRPDIRIITDRNSNMEAILLSAVSGFAKELGDKMRSYPKARCTPNQQCIDLVKSGLHVYIAGRDDFLLKALKDDFLATGKCNMEMGKEAFALHSAWALQKKSPYLNDVNIGIMRQRDAGLTNFWAKMYVADVHQCLHNGRYGQESELIEPLDLKSLIGTFVILNLGWVLSFLVFVVERILS